jgi:hypothetical protein
MFTASRIPMRRFSPTGFERSALAAAHRVQIERLAPRAAATAHGLASYEHDRRAGEATLPASRQVRAA